MDARKLLEYLAVAEKLKNNTRHSWTSSGRQESVAEHSWRLAMMAYFMKDEFPAVDLNKVMVMCLFHDLGEAITGDIPAFSKSKEDTDTETKEVQKLLSSLPSPYDQELSGLFQEMEEQVSAESKLFKALDKLEAVIQHNEADISTWIPREFDLNLIYGSREVAFSEYLTGVRELIKEDTVQKIRLSGVTAEA